MRIGILADIHEDLGHLRWALAALEGHGADRLVVLGRGRVIAEGSSDQLKDRVGGERLEVTLVEAGEGSRAVEALGPMSDESPSVEGAIVRLPVRTRSGAIVEAVRRLSDAQVEVDDLVLRRPTLDDVFLTLTGTACHDDPEEQPR